MLSRCCSAGFVILAAFIVAAAGSHAVLRPQGLHTQQPRGVVYGFAVDGRPNHRHYDWSVLTHVGWKTAPDHVAAAHKHGARVEVQGIPPTDVILDPEKWPAWIAGVLGAALNASADGINFDWEGPAAPGSPEAQGYAGIVRATAAAFRKAMPDATISVDVAWSPYDIDGRNFEWLSLAGDADLLFIMAYDTQSQVFGRCVACANTPYDSAKRAVRQWLRLGVPAHKLVLGLPWYAYDYPCEPGADGKPPPPDVEFCVLKSVPFRGVACSDAAGVQRNYAQVMQLLFDYRNTTPVRWDALQRSPYFNYVDEGGTVRQVWFDDARSLAPKYQLAVDHGLRGLGMWNLDTLDYWSRNTRMQRATQDMWSALADAAGRLRPVRRDHAHVAQQ